LVFETFSYEPPFVIWYVFRGCASPCNDIVGVASSFHNRAPLGADPFDSVNHVLETDTVIRILIYNIYP
jgi:hypothetical protein